MRYLRNAISHFNIKFESDSSGELIGLIVWNRRPRPTQITWKARISIQNLDLLVHKFVAMLLQEG